MTQSHVPADPLILDEVTRTFGTVTAVDHLSLRVRQGEVLGLLGHNGAGKTTTVRLFAGLLHADSGDVRVAGLDPRHDGPDTRRRLGVLPARPVVDDRLTARENLRFAADVFDVPADDVDGRIEVMLAQFGLDERGDDRVAGFSTGMRQRLSLGRVLLPEPPILLLDEPTAALDPVAAHEVRRLIGQLARDEHRTVVLCTHDLAEAEELCDRVVVLEHGRVLVSGTPAELATTHGMSGVSLDVGVGQLATARSVIERVLDGTAEIENPRRLRLGGVARDQIPTLVRALVEAEVDVYELRPSTPSLRDVYLALHGRDPGDERRAS